MLGEDKTTNISTLELLQKKSIEVGKNITHIGNESTGISTSKKKES